MNIFKLSSLATSILLVGLSLSLTSCMEIKNHEDSPPQNAELKPNAHNQSKPSPEESSSVLGQPIALARLIAGDQPGKYLVSIDRSEASLIIRNTIGASEQRTFDVKIGEAFNDHSVIMGAHYVYELRKSSEEGFKILKRFEIKVPVDLELNSVIPCDQLPKSAMTKANENDIQYSFGRIFVQSTGGLLTLGRNISIRTTQLIAQGGSVMSFQAGIRAPELTNGRAGGVFSLMADSSIGNLSIFMRGEAGGQGLVGKSHTERARRCIGRATERPLPECILGNGQSGLSGGQGMSGGSSGQLFLNLGDSRDFKLLVYHEPGIGGSGGLGGPGQLGAVAEAVAGAGEQNNIIGNIAFFKAGLTGNQGPTGPSGATGKFGENCLLEKGSSQYKCEQGR